MLYSMTYSSKLGNLIVVSDETSIIGLCFEKQQYFMNGIQEPVIENSQVLILKQAKQWLDRYFAGDEVNAKELCLQPRGSDFQQKVWNILLQIPYGKVTTYGQIAKQLATFEHKKCIAAQAVGSAIGHNPIAIIIPCHRVIGKSGQLTGYAAGIDVKQQLLELERGKIR